MAKNKLAKTSKKAISPFSPVNRQGLKVGTAAIEGGVLGALFDKPGGSTSPAEHLWKHRDVGTAAKGFSNRLKGKGSLPWGMIVVGGVLVIVAGKWTGIKKAGPLLAS